MKTFKIDDFAVYTTNDGTGNAYTGRIVGVNGNRISVVIAYRKVKEIDNSQIIKTYTQAGFKIN